MTDSNPFRRASQLFSKNVVACTLSLWGALACSEPGELDSTEPVAPSTPASVAPQWELPNPAESAAQRSYEQAKQAIADAQQAPHLPGAEQFRARRAELVARAKGEPVVFVATPEYRQSSTPGVERERLLLLSSDKYFSAVRALVKRYRKSPQRLREVLLRDGYVYSEEPELAFALLSLVGAHHLFDEPEIWVHRGERLMRARLDQDRYRFVDGPHEGAPVRLMHLDRVGVGEPPAPLHVDFRALKYRLHFDQARPIVFTEQHVIAELRYGATWVTTLLQRNGAQLLKTHEALPPEQVEPVAAARALNARRQPLYQSLRTAMNHQFSERLPFDEPKTEEGQEDGKLRRPWQYAYLGGHSSYEVNGDSYPVFGKDGAPLIPQVCIDFVLDTLERASGTWWQPSTGARSRNVGGLDWNQFQRDHLRRTKYFIDFAQERPDWFSVYHVPKRQRVALGYKTRFFKSIEQSVQRYQPGDIVFIDGVTPWDEENNHTHAFIIYEQDPITLMPILIAGNPGPANLWSWETEARRTPQRKVIAVVRPKPEWLSQVLDVSDAPTDSPILIPRRAVRATQPGT